MKRGYKKLLIFEIIIFLILILDSFIENILNRYTILFFLFLLILLFKKKFGVEKEKKRYTKDIVYEILIIYLLAFILYYLFGLVIGFYQNDNYYTLYALKEILMPLILAIVLKEYLRSLIIPKCDGSKILLVITCILFIMFDITNLIQYDIFTDKEKVFHFCALYLLPSVSNNIVASYIVFKSNYRINILWLLILKLYVYLLPIIPDTGEYILSIINMLFPFVICNKLKNFFDRESDSEVDEDHNKLQMVSLVFCSIFIIIVVYFTSGHFHYYSVAIATGSMQPNINKGDVVIVEKIGDDFDDIKVGQVLAYRYENVLVVHRIVEIIEEDNQYYFYTKGDANTDVDSYVIYEEQVAGIVNKRIPYIGLPTVWLNEI